MKLVVLGASGGCGQALVELGLGRKHEMVAVVRPSSTYVARPGARIERGSILDPAFLDRVLLGADAVCSALGLRRKTRNPWSALEAPFDFTSKSATAIVASMKRTDVRRVVAISAAGVRESWRRVSPLLRLIFQTSSIGVAYRDLDLMEQIYESSGLDWCCVRPTTLRDGPTTGRAVVVDAYPLSAMIRRADVAAYMLDILERGQLEPRTPMISSS